MATPYIFDEEQLELFELDADNFNPESLRKHYRKYVLKWHPDKGGTSEMFVRGQSAYQNLLEGLTTFAVWLSAMPGLTLDQTIRPRPGLSRGSSSAAQPAPPAPDLAPAPDLSHARYILIIAIVNS